MVTPTLFGICREAKQQGNGLRGPDDGSKNPKIDRTDQLPRIRKQLWGNNATHSTSRHNTMNFWSPEQSNQYPTDTRKTGSLGRGRQRLIRNGQSSDSAIGSPAQPNQTQDSISLLRVVTENVTDAEVDRVIEDVRRTN